MSPSLLCEKLSAFLRILYWRVHLVLAEPESKHAILLMVCCNERASNFMCSLADVQIGTTHTQWLMRTA